jgi:chromosome segregation protein
MTHRAGDVQDRLRTAREELAKAEAEDAQIRTRLAQLESTSADLSRHMDRVRSEAEARRTRHVEGMRQVAALGNQASGLESQLNALQVSAQRSSHRLQELEQAWSRQDAELQQSLAEEQAVAAQANEQATAWEAAQVGLGENRRVLARRQQELALLQGKLAALRQRADFLQELERQHAGLSAGVQDVLAAAKQESADVAQEIHGMVADLIEAGVEIAPLVDVALGDATQHIVVSGDRLVKRIENGDFQAAGRVGLIRLDTLTATPPLLLGPLILPGRGELQGRPGVVGRADRLVRTTEPYRALVGHLLGDTWFVERLTDALALSRTVGKGMRFVTSKGELLEADGTLIVGPSQANVGLVSRRSELRSLQREIVDVQRRSVQFAEEITRLQENIDRQDRQTRLLADACRKLDAALADQRVRTRTLEDRHQQLETQKTALATELRDASAKWDAVQQQAAALRDELAKKEAEIAELERQIREDEQRSEQVQSRLDACHRELTRAQVELAKSEQRLEGLQVQNTQFETDQRERSRALTEVQTQLAQAAQRRAQAELHILRLTSELAELLVRKERQAAQIVEHNGRRQRLAAERSQLAGEQEALRRRIHRLEEQQHKLELSAGEVQHERQTLAARIREDYGIEISQVTQRQETAEEEQQRAEVEAEIADLRNKINRIGAVNLDALEEVDDLQTRYETLSTQYQDLTQAKESLERIIQKINADSRRLFLETLEAIRANFQVLYRKAFGGGRADLVLEEGKDVLEAGVDIVATPPGKPSFSNTLLSGGEKALTAVALLMAIFQFRPSPFCILDEVDAPFDEANIGRFVNVLKDFLASTKFVIVTHSKKTMVSANTLYGVTMQESGVSKRVSVRFEDVSEDGHISVEAVRREELGPIEGERAA